MQLGLWREAAAGIVWRAGDRGGSDRSSQELEDNIESERHLNRKLRTTLELVDAENKLFRDQADRASPASDALYLPPNAHALAHVSLWVHAHTDG
jgi:hypothetical protein